MRRYVYLFMMIVLLGLTFTGCGSNTNNSNEITPSETTPILSDENSNEDLKLLLSTKDNITRLKNAGISGVKLQNMVMERCNGIGPQNRPYIFNGVQDCYGYVRQVWNAILSDGKTHSEDYYPKSYNRSRWLGVSGGLPVGTAPDSNWVAISNRDNLLPGDVLATHQGHAWGAQWHGGIYAGKSGATHYNWDNSKMGGLNGAYRRTFYSGFKYYYKPIHDLLAYGGSNNTTLVGCAVAWPKCAAVGNSENKVYFFNYNQYIRYDFVAGHADPGYPRTINGNWPGLEPFAQSIDAAFVSNDAKKAYFFKNDQYIVYDVQAARADPGYPKPISGNWPGLDKIGNQVDTAFIWPNSNQLFFFRGSNYVRFNLETGRVDDGYPKTIAGNWPGVEPFASGLNAIFVSPKKDKVYFFKGSQYIRYDVKTRKADAGYPKSTATYWPGLDW